MGAEFVWWRTVVVTEEVAVVVLPAVAVAPGHVDALGLVRGAAVPEADQSLAMVVPNLPSSHVPVRDQCKHSK